jgi:hypothetical protein
MLLIELIVSGESKFASRFPMETLASSKILCILIVSS